MGICLLGLPLGGERKLRRPVIEAVEPVQGCTILELCCGTATISLMAGEIGAKVYGLDIARGMLRVADEKAHKQGIKIGLVEADAVSIPFKENAFDRVIVSLGLHEMPFDITRSIFKEVKRVLKEKGRFVIFDYHKGEGFAGLLQEIFLLFTEHETAKEFIKTDLQREMREAGFKKFQRRFLFRGTAQIVTVIK